MENVFFWAIQKNRDSKVNRYVEEMTQFNPQLTIHDFVEIFVDKAFANMNIVSTKVMRFYDQRYSLKYGLTADYLDCANVLVDPYLELCQKNKANTFRLLSVAEARFIFKCGLTLVERLFANQDPIAGTAKHRQIAVENTIKLLAA